KFADMPEYREVGWESEISRDQLSTATKNSLGAISTLFQLPDHAAEEILKASHGESAAEESETVAEEVEESALANIRSQAQEFIKDRISSQDSDNMERLIAALLRSMGYKTRITPVGPDRGVDIMASPDGLGFEQPRIIVEVKHRGEAMGSQAIRSFLGGRHQEDKGLYVSTGGFTKDARYEADRAYIPLTLMDLDGLVTALSEHYESLDEEGKTLIPLTKVYWPT
ncbi:MAG TPA: restriction endonuclease, partial [Gammaproteobacteria bacterium]|nr:restriction endonuclease [Gammaproteobacteria bacterium]